MAARSGRRTLEEKSWTESPVAAAAVVLVTVPETVTLPLGVAYVGLIDVIVIDIGCAGPASPAAMATRACRADRRPAGRRPVPGPGLAGRRRPDVRHSRGMPKCYSGRPGAGPLRTCPDAGAPTPYPRCPCQTPTT